MNILNMIWLSLITHISLTIRPTICAQNGHLFHEHTASVEQLMTPLSNDNIVQWNGLSRNGPLHFENPADLHW